MTEHKSFLENLSKDLKPESFSQEVFVPVNNNKRIIKLAITAAVLVAILVLGYLFYQSTQTVKVIELKGMNISDASLWAQKNGITLISKNVFSNEVAESVIVDQEYATNSTVEKGDTISIGLSQGPDPEQKITFPDVMSMKTAQLDAWVKENKLTGISITTANSNVVPKDSVISFTFTDGDAENFLRKNRVALVLSSGPAAVSGSVVAVDFSAMNVGKILQWGVDNTISITIQEDYNKYYAKGAVISQSVKTGTEILKSSIIIVTISKGEQITVPDLSRLTSEEGSSWAKQNGVTLTVIPKYSDSILLGSFFGQSLKAGSGMIASDSLKVYQSLGQVSIPSFLGKTKMDVLSWQQTANSKGASIAVNFQELNGDASSVGKVLSQSTANDYLPLNGTVTVALSRGMQLVIPNLIGMIKADSILAAKNIGLTLYFEYENSASVPEGKVIRQSISAGSSSTDALPMTIVISKGP